MKLNKRIASIIASGLIVATLTVGCGNQDVEYQEQQIQQEQQVVDIEQIRADLEFFDEVTANIQDITSITTYTEEDMITMKTLLENEQTKVENYICANESKLAKTRLEDCIRFNIMYLDDCLMGEFDKAEETVLPTVKMNIEMYNKALNDLLLVIDNNAM